MPTSPGASKVFPSFPLRFALRFAPTLNPPLLQRWHRRLRDRRLHEFLWYCVPGVVVAALIRVWLTASMPYGQFHFDTPDFLQTPYDLLHGHRLTLHNKKTFLTPLLYTLPFVLHVPRSSWRFLLGQHLLGTLLVLMVGALARLWFVFWRVVIVPLTVLVAVHPSLLWFEHTLLAETHYVFCVVWAALAGTLFVRRPGWESLGFLLAALFSTAGARPEGRLFLAFGVFVVAGRVPALVAAGTGQAGGGGGLLLGDVAGYPHRAGGDPFVFRRSCTWPRTNPASRPT